MHRKMFGFWCILLLNLMTASTQPMPGSNMYYENGPPQMEQPSISSSLMEKFPSIFDFLREPFGNGSLFSSNLPGFLQHSSSSSPPPSYHHQHHHHPPPSPPHHFKMPRNHRLHGPLHHQASFIHPIISKLTTKKSPTKDEPEPYTFEPIVLFHKPEQEQGNLSSAELLRLEATLREKITEQTQGLSTMASQIVTTFSKPGEKDQIQEEARASSITTPPVEKATAEAVQYKNNSNNATDQSLTQAESYQQPRHYSNTPGKPYSFSYVVKNKYGNNFNQEEHSDGSTVRGQYRTLLPDGRIQTVMYIADKIHGYNAVVTYEGTAKHPDTDHYKIKTKNEPKLQRFPTPVAKRPATVTFPQITNNFPVPQSNYGIVPRVRPVPAVVNSNGYSQGYVSPLLLARPASSGRYLNPTTSFAPQSSSFYRHQTNSHSLNTVFNNQGHYSQNSNQYVEFPRYASGFPDPGIYQSRLRARPPPPHTVNRPILVPTMQRVPLRNFRRPIQSLVGVPNHSHPTVLKPTSQHHQEDVIMNQEAAHTFFRQGHPLNAMLAPGRNEHDIHSNPKSVLNNGIQSPIIRNQPRPNLKIQSSINPLPSNNQFIINQSPSSEHSSSSLSSTSAPLELLKLELPPGDRSKLFETVPLPLPYPLVHAKIPQSNLISVPVSDDEQKQVQNDNNANNNNIQMVMKDASQHQASSSSSSNDDHLYDFPEEQESIKYENEYNEDLNPSLDQVINLDALKNSIFEQVEKRQHQESSSASSLSPTQFKESPLSTTSNFRENNPIIQHLNSIRGIDNLHQPQKGPQYSNIPLASEVKVMVMNPLQFQSPQSKRHQKRISKLGKGTKVPPYQPHTGESHLVQHLFSNLGPLTEQIRSQKFNEWFDPPGFNQNGQAKKSDRVRKKISRILTKTTTTTSSPVTDDDQKLHHDLDLESQFLNIQLNKTNPVAHTSTTFPPYEKAIKNIKLRRVAKRIRKKIRRITTTTIQPPT